MLRYTYKRMDQVLPHISAVPIATNGPYPGELLFTVIMVGFDQTINAHLIKDIFSEAETFMLFSHINNTNDITMPPAPRELYVSS